MIDESKATRLVDILNNEGLPLATACSLVGLDYEAVQLELKTDPVLADRCALALGTMEQKAIASIVRAFQTGDRTDEEEEETREKVGDKEITRRTKTRSKTDWRAAGWFLERMFAERYGPKVDTVVDDPRMKKTVTIRITEAERAEIANPLVPQLESRKAMHEPLNGNGNGNGNGHH